MSNSLPATLATPPGRSMGRREARVSRDVLTFEILTTAGEMPGGMYADVGRCVLVFLAGYGRKAKFFSARWSGKNAAAFYSHRRPRHASMATASWTGFVYVASVIRRLGRRIVDWRASWTAPSSFVLDALEQGRARASRRPDSQYVSSKYTASAWRKRASSPL